MVLRGVRPDKNMIKPGYEALKNLEGQMETNKAWQPGEFGPHYDSTGKRVPTQKEFRLHEEKQDRAKRFMDKVEEAKKRRGFSKGGTVREYGKGRK